MRGGERSWRSRWAAKLGASCGAFFLFFKQKTAYEIPKRDWSSDVCSSDLRGGGNGNRSVTSIQKQFQPKVETVSGDTSHEACLAQKRSWFHVDGTHRGHGHTGDPDQFGDTDGAHRYQARARARTAP